MIPDFGLDLTTRRASGFGFDADLNARRCFPERTHAPGRA
jgi:hypothetical protein